MQSIEVALEVVEQVGFGGAAEEIHTARVRETEREDSLKRGRGDISECLKRRGIERKQDIFCLKLVDLGDWQTAAFFLKAIGADKCAVHYVKPESLRKAVAIARGFVAPSGKNLVCIPAFTDITIDGEERTAIKLIVEAI